MDHSRGVMDETPEATTTIHTLFQLRRVDFRSRRFPLPFVVRPGGSVMMQHMTIALGLYSVRRPRHLLLLRPWAPTRSRRGKTPRKRPRPNAPPIYNKLRGSRARGQEIAADEGGWFLRRLVTHSIRWREQHRTKSALANTHVAARWPATR